MHSIWHTRTARWHGESDPHRHLRVRHTRCDHGPHIKLQGGSTTPSASVPEIAKICTRWKNAPCNTSEITTDYAVPHVRHPGRVHATGSGVSGLASQMARARGSGSLERTRGGAGRAATHTDSQAVAGVAMLHTCGLLPLGHGAGAPASNTGHRLWHQLVQAPLSQHARHRSACGLGRRTHGHAVVGSKPARVAQHHRHQQPALLRP